MTVERHQLAGMDERQRGFNRLVEIDQAESAFRAILRYETTRVSTEPVETAAAALTDLVRRLHERGYSQLRSRLSFRGDAYLGSQEPWVDYPDPVRPRLWRRLVAWLRR